MTSLPLARNWAISKFLSRDEVERFRLVSHSRRALGEWLARGFVWHHVVTLTFALRQREGEQHVACTYMCSSRTLKT